MTTFSNVFVCADVGGTFTDCFAGWQDASGQTRSHRLKILSNGLIRCRLIESVSRSRLTIHLPPELGGSLPRDFFRTASVSSVVQGETTPLGVVEAFDGESSEIAIRRNDDVTDDFADEQSVIEIDCRLEAPVLATRLILGVPIDQPLPTLTVRLGTTRGTNALLTRSGAQTALVTNHGFGDALLIGEQDRPNLFDLAIDKGMPLAESILEIRGRMDSKGREVEPLSKPELEVGFRTLRQRGIESVAICLLHSYLNPRHELVVESIANEVGFLNVSRSSEVAPLIKFVARAETTALDAYLSPVLSTYVDRVLDQFGGSERCVMDLMTSGGNLVASNRFRGRDSVLSGPAGGVIGLESVAIQAGCPLAIGLDMGGTSTDVSRLSGTIGRRYESRINGIRIMTPMMDIHTVAAGGGSICDFRGGRLVVGPESAGAAPGPACYGAAGPLTVTDVNLLLGRLLVTRFPFPLDQQASEERLQSVAARMPAPPPDMLELAEGFLEIAVTHMAEAVRAITTARGVDVRDHALIGFGGAAAQHVCRIADSLGIRRIVDHPQSSLLSAMGIGAASVGQFKTKGIYQPIDEVSAETLRDEAKQLRDDLSSSLAYADEASPQRVVESRFEVDLRYEGTEASLAIKCDGDLSSSETLPKLREIQKKFHESHQQRFGYQHTDRLVELVSLRCEVRQANEAWQERLFGSERPNLREEGKRKQQTRVYARGRMQVFDVIERDQLKAGTVIKSCSLVVSDQSTLVVEPGWSGMVAEDGVITLTPASPNTSHSRSLIESNAAVSMEIIARRLQSIADAMGEVLRRTAVSVNVKERLDFSCAIFGNDGTLIANAPHVPVHLGAMGHTVRHLQQAFPEMSRGDCFVSNDPYAGGSHLPDVTLVTPVFLSVGEKTPSFFVASRAHHAEIGGRTPGSMPPLASRLEDEGVLISAFALYRNGQGHEDALATQLASARYPSRNIDENLADLRAQVAAGRYGAEQLSVMVGELTRDHVDAMIGRLLDVADQSVQTWIKRLPTSPLSFSDRLDDGTPIAVSLQRKGDRLSVDFTGTGGVHSGGFNATESIVHSALLYVMRCYCESNLPLCEGALRSIDLTIPTGLLSPPAAKEPGQSPAVVAGNVETSQRIVDVLLGALGQSATGQPVLRAVAASQGTMNNVLIGNEKFGYYETIGGGSGATVFGRGADAVHTHMTNTRITDVEILESRLPIKLRTFCIRQGSGGGGKHCGGDGLIREYEFLEALTVSLITGRRNTQPYGAAGGQPGACGKNMLIDSNGTERPMDFAETTEVSPGDRLRIETPGGGGWGKA
ncbi:MAG: hydantoinase B/oxoprolinase family protein [Planctomycetota bacterium]